jgi:hypothetical protein
MLDHTPKSVWSHSSPCHACIPSNTISMTRDSRSEYGSQVRLSHLLVVSESPDKSVGIQFLPFET